MSMSGPGSRLPSESATSRIKQARLPRCLTTVSVGLLLGLLAGAALGQNITEFPIPTAGSAPLGIAAGSDGALWFTGSAGNKIGRITTAGVVTEFSVPTVGAGPYFIAAGSDGALWFTESTGNKIGRITTAGVITEFTVPTGSSFPCGIAAGPDGALWFTELSGNKIGRITTAGVITEFAVPTASSRPASIDSGLDGALWFTESGGSKVGRITTSGAITEYLVPTPGGQPLSIACGSGSFDSLCWFTESGGKIGRITTSGIVDETDVSGVIGTSLIGITVSSNDIAWFSESSANLLGGIFMARNSRTGINQAFLTGTTPIPTSNAMPLALTTGPEGAVWFTEHSGNKVGRFITGAGLEPPVSGSISGPSAGTTSAALTFTAHPIGGTSPYTFAWTCVFQPGVPNFVGGSSTQACQFSGAGQYTVMARITDAVGVVGNAAKVVTIIRLPAPSADFTITGATGDPSNGNYNGTVGVPITFTATETNAGSYVWLFGDGTAGLTRSFTKTYSIPGFFSGRLTVGGDGINTADSATRAFGLTSRNPNSPAATWRLTSAALLDVKVSTIALDPRSARTIYVGGQTGTSVHIGAAIRRSDDGGSTWQGILGNIGGLSVVALCVNPVNPDVVYVGVYGGGVYKSVNRGESWTRLAVGNVPWVSSFVMDQRSPETLYVALGGDGLYKTTDGGGTWTLINAGLGGTGVVAEIRLDPVSSSRLYVAGAGKLYRSDDSGATWQVVREGVGALLWIDPTDPATLYVLGEGEGLLKSVDRGITWTPIGAGLPFNLSLGPLQSDPANRAVLYVGTSGAGVFRSADGGLTWTAFNNGIENQTVRSLLIPPSGDPALYAGTDAGLFNYRSGAPACSADATTLCLNSSRFRIQVDWRVPSQGTSGVGAAVPLAGGDTGYFWFFNSANVELMVKVLDGRGFNGRFWVFYGALSDVEYTLRVTDTLTGAVKTYFNPQGRLASVADTSAFAAASVVEPASSVATIQDSESSVPEQRTGSAPLTRDLIASDVDRSSEGSLQFSSLEPAQVGVPCVQSLTTLCLNGSRFAVQVTWRVPSQGTDGVGTAVPLTGDTGYFWFFNSANVELVIKVLDGRGFNGKFWVFYGALSDVEYTIRVTDTATGEVSTYLNSSGQLASVADTSAFPREPETGALAGAFNSPGPYPTPTNVTYINKAGQTLTTVSIPDQIFMAVSPALLSAASALQLITANSGTVIAQMPAAGLYWIRVRPGTAAFFISAVQGDSAVIHVGPNVPLTGSQIDIPLSLFSDTATTPLSPGDCWIVQLDVFRPAPGNNVCGMTHGQGVNAILGQDGLCTAKYDVAMIDGRTNQPALLNGHIALAGGSDVGFALARTAEGGSLAGHRLSVNVSLGAIGDPNDGLDRSVCESDRANPICFCPSPPNSPDCVGDYAAWKSNAFGFLVGIAGAVRYMPRELRDNTDIVVSAGNSGLDLTQEIGLLRSFFSDLPQVLIAGSLRNGQPFLGHNHSTDPSHILYAPGVDVPIPGTGGCLGSGTSLAAPALTNLGAQLSQRFPTLTSAQLKTAIENAAPLVNGLRVSPTLAQAEAAARGLVQPPLPICEYSISPSTSPPFPGSGGNGIVTVAGTPAGCSGSWSAVSNDGFITITSPATGSNAGPSTVGYSVSANASATSRTGTITIAGRAFTVSQAGVGPPTDPPGNTKYDGTYDMTINGCTFYNPTPTTYVCAGDSVIHSFPSGFNLVNGSIIGGVFIGGVTNYTFGNIQFRGPCPPDPSASAVFTGILNVGALSKFGQGTYVCSGDGIDPGYAGGRSSTWQVFNGH